MRNIIIGTVAPKPCVVEQRLEISCFEDVKKVGQMFLREPVLNQSKDYELHFCLHGECTDCHIVFFLSVHPIDILALQFINKVVGIMLFRHLDQYMVYYWVVWKDGLKNKYNSSVWNSLRQEVGIPSAPISYTCFIFVSSLLRHVNQLSFKFPLRRR